jgi:hypothetical protein
MGNELRNDVCHSCLSWPCRCDKQVCLTNEHKLKIALDTLRHIARLDVVGSYLALEALKEIDGVKQHE